MEIFDFILIFTLSSVFYLILKNFILRKQIKFLEIKFNDLLNIKVKKS